MLSFARCTAARSAVVATSTIRKQLQQHQPFRNAYVFRRTRYPSEKLRIKDPANATQENINRQAVVGQPFEELLVEHPYENLSVFEVVEKEQPPEPVTLIILRNTDDFGKRGQVVTVEDPIEAKTLLLLTGAAVYATPENLEKYKDILIPEDNFKFSSSYIKKIMPELTRKVLPVTMNMHNEWTIEPFHIKVCFDRIKIEVPLEAIEIPKNREIKGPNLDIEGKEFYVYITINKSEKIPIRCVLHHRSDEPNESQHLNVIGWMHRFHDPVFEEDRDFLAKMKRNPFGPIAAKQKDAVKDLERFSEWKLNRDKVLQEME